MDNIDRLNEAETLIKRYRDVSKIRDEVERIRQFVEVDAALKEYYDRVLQPLFGQHLRLAFNERSNSKTGLKVFTYREIRPRPEQEKAILDFTERLGKAMAYTFRLDQSAEENEGV